MRFRKGNKSIGTHRGLGERREETDEERKEEEKSIRSLFGPVD